MDLLKLVAIVVILGAAAFWLIRYFEIEPPISKWLKAAVVILLGLYFLDGIGFSLPNVL